MSTISPDIGNLMNNLDGPSMFGGYNTTFNNDKAFDIPNNGPSLSRAASINASFNPSQGLNGLPGSINNDTYSWKPINNQQKQDLNVPGLKPMTSIDPFINT
jgi:hypothetical protein